MESHCPSCGERTRAWAAFCPRCGFALGREGTPRAWDAAPAAAPNVRRGTASWEELRHLLAFYLVLMGCSLFFGLADRVQGGPWMLVAFSAVWDAVTLAFLVRDWKKVRNAFRFRMPRTRFLPELLFACVAAFLFLRAYFAVFKFFGWPFLHPEDTYLKAGWPLWSVFGMICLDPAVFEEAAFRGILQTRLSRILSRKEALLIQAALFSVMHLSPVIFVSHFVMGLLLGWFRLRTKNVYFGMALHASWNAMAVLQALGH